MKIDKNGFHQRALCVQININPDYSRCKFSAAQHKDSLLKHMIHYYFYLQSIIQQVFCNPLSDRLAETNFYRFSLRAHVCVALLRGFVLSWDDMIPETYPRVQLTKRIYARCDAGTPRAGGYSKPRNARRGRWRCRCLVFSHGATNSALAASRMSLATALAENHSEKPIESTMHFFLSARAAGQAFLSAIGVVSSRSIVTRIVQLLKSIGFL